jgi:hypothetical protein
MFSFIGKQVQPFKDEKQLHQIMKAMQVQYSQQRHQHPSVDTIKEGRLYAALHHDGSWYRYVPTSALPFSFRVAAREGTCPSVCVPPLICPLSIGYRG